MRYIIILASVLVCLTACPIWAQEDAIAPVLLEFAMGPRAFDTGLSTVNLDWCAEAQDDLSGILRVNVDLCHETDGFIAAGGNNPVGLPLHATVCGTIPLPQFSPYGDYFIFVLPVDDIRNVQCYTHPDSPCGCSGTAEDLCTIGTCSLSNRPENEIPDSDGDGVPDDADNCPNDANADQADADLDLMGNACDPFPNDRDNEQAQCEHDLGQALGDVAACNLDLGVCQTNLGNTQTALRQAQDERDQALAAINAMRTCLASYKKENGKRCRDDVDNDCDGLIDRDDPDCQK